MNRLHPRLARRVRPYWDQPDFWTRAAELKHEDDLEAWEALERAAAEWESRSSDDGTDDTNPR
jgi:hypothetical protein